MEQPARPPVKIRLLATIGIEGKIVRPDTVVEVEADVADNLLYRKKAELVEGE